MAILSITEVSDPFDRILLCYDWYDSGEYRQNRRGRYQSSVPCGGQADGVVLSPLCDALIKSKSGLPPRKTSDFRTENDWIFYLRGKM
jgi:hypothetical protein